MCSRGGVPLAGELEIAASLLCLPVTPLAIIQYSAVDARRTASLAYADSAGNANAMTRCSQ